MPLTRAAFQHERSGVNTRRGRRPRSLPGRSLPWFPGPGEGLSTTQDSLFHHTCVGVPAHVTPHSQQAIEMTEEAAPFVLLLATLQRR